MGDFHLYYWELTEGPPHHSFFLGKTGDAFATMERCIHELCHEVIYLGKVKPDTVLARGFYHTRSYEGEDNEMKTVSLACEVITRLGFRPPVTSILTDMSQINMPRDSPYRKKSMRELKNQMRALRRGKELSSYAEELVAWIKKGVKPQRRARVQRRLLPERAS